MMNDWFTSFFLFVFDWRMLSILGIIFIEILRKIPNVYWNHFFDNIQWNLHNVSLAFLGLGVLFTRIGFSWQSMPAQATQTIVQIVLFMSYTHMRSFLFYSALILWYWYNWKNLLPALYAGWFAIAVIELTFIAQHFIAFQAFLGWEWYLPFIAIMIPFLFDRSNYHFKKKGLVFICAGIFIQYFLLIWQQDAFTTFVNGQLINNVVILANPTLGTWIHEGLDHLLKSLMTIGFAFMEYHR